MSSSKIFIIRSLGVPMCFSGALLENEHAESLLHEGSKQSLGRHARENLESRKGDDWKACPRERPDLLPTKWDLWTSELWKFGSWRCLEFVRGGEDVTFLVSVPFTSKEVEIKGGKEVNHSHESDDNLRKVQDDRQKDGKRIRGGCCRRSSHSKPQNTSRNER